MLFFNPISNQFPKSEMLNLNTFLMSDKNWKSPSPSLESSWFARLLLADGKHLVDRSGASTKAWGTGRDGKQWQIIQLLSLTLLGNDPQLGPCILLYASTWRKGSCRLLEDFICRAFHWVPLFWLRYRWPPASLFPSSDLFIRPQLAARTLKDETEWPGMRAVCVRTAPVCGLVGTHLPHALCVFALSPWAAVSSHRIWRRS